MDDQIGRETVRGWWLEAQLAYRTRERYAFVLDRWFARCDRGGLDVWAARRNDVDAWRNELSRKLSPTSVANHLACLSSFYRYAVAEVEPPPIEHNPAQNVRRPKVDQMSKADGLSDEEAQQLLAAAEEHGPRTAALVHLLLGTAARVSEIVGARVNDIGWDQNVRALAVTRKGGVRALVHLRPDTFAAVERYLAGRDPVPDGWLIATAGGRRMTRQTAYQVVRQLAQKTLQREVTVGPHDLRHTAISIALDHESLNEARMFAGHARAATTERYDRRAHTRGAAAAESVEKRLRPSPVAP